MKINPVIGAIVRRDLVRHFTSPTAYVFIFIFLAACVVAQYFQNVFFGNNLANLDPLNDWFPWILVFFSAAVSMRTWADERSQGTDELLLTLPASDRAILAGKYLSALAIYSASLLFTLSLLAMLFMLGRPDLGVLAGTYFGYWLMGAALLAVTMVGSMLSDNLTVAFMLAFVMGLAVVGLGLIGGIAANVSSRMEHTQTASGLDAATMFRVTMAGVAVAFGVLASVLSRPGGQEESIWNELIRIASIILSAVATVIFALDIVGWRQLADAGVDRPFRDLTSGVLSFKSFIYFTALGGLGLAVNYYLIRRRRMASGHWHLPVRALSLVVAAASICVLANRTEARLDLTQERLHTLSAQTRATFGEIDAERPVYIQAWISPEVSQDYVQVRANLLSLLREYDVLGGSKILVKVHETSPSSDEAVEAEEKYRIFPVGRNYLGLVVTSGPEEVVIPFFFKGLPIEYELTRSIRTVMKAKRLKIGVMSTDAKWTGGMDMQTFARIQPWPIIEELKKQYEVTTVVPPEQDMHDALDVLVVPQASSMTQPQMDRLLAFVKQGTKTLFLDDPMPVQQTDCSPTEEKKRPGGMGMGGGPGEKKGNIAAFYRELGIAWNPTEIVWDQYNPHRDPQLRDVPPEVVFVSPNNGTAEAFATTNPISSGLQEVVLIFPGCVRPANTPGLTFRPLMQAGRSTGTIHFEEIWERDFLGRGYMSPNRRHVLNPAEYVLAAQVSGRIAAAKPEEKEANINVAFIADIDLISEQFFVLRREAAEHFDFDNVTFVLNCIDALAGDDSFLELRKRRPRHRTLETIEAKTRAHEERQLREDKQAEDDASLALNAAQGRLDAKLKEITDRTDIDPMSKQRMKEQVHEQENRRFEVQKRTIENEKKRKVARSVVVRDQQINQIWLSVRWQAMALVLSLPAILGILVFVNRLKKEMEARR